MKIAQRVLMCLCLFAIPAYTQEEVEPLADRLFEEIMSGVLAGDNSYPDSINRLLLDILGGMEDDRDLKIELVDDEKTGFNCGTFVTTDFVAGVRTISIYRPAIDRVYSSLEFNAHQTKTQLVWGLIYQEVLWQLWREGRMGGLEKLKQFLDGTLHEEEWVEIEAKVSAQMATEVTRPLLDAGYFLLEGLKTIIYILESGCEGFEDKAQCSALKLSIRNLYRSIRKKCTK